MKKKLVNPLFLAALAVGLLSIFLIVREIKKIEAEKVAQVQQQQAEKEKAQKELEEQKTKNEALEKAQKSGGVPAAETREVLCFKTPLQPRTEINRVMIELRQIPVDMVPEGAVLKIEDAIGKFTVRSVDAKEVVTTTKVKSIREIGGMSYRITPGMRAIAVAVTPVNSTGNLISDGDYVDMLLTEKDKAGDFIRTRIFLQNIKILSFFASPESDQTAGLAKTAPDTATVEVTPEQAEGLIQAKSMGDLSLVLRSVKDQNTVRTRGFERYELSNDLGIIQSRSRRTLSRVQEEQKLAQEAQKDSEGSTPSIQTEGSSQNMTPEVNP